MNPAIYLRLLLFVLPFFYIILTRKTSKKLPPGSLGLPILGQSLWFLLAMHANTTEQWLQERVRKYGPISKLILFGIPTVFLHGQAANKFIFTCDGDTLAHQQPPSFRRICGKRNMTTLTGDDHKRVRGALVSFLRPEILKQYVGMMDEEVRKYLEMHWNGNQKIAVMPSIKSLTFNIMSSLIFGLQQGTSRDAFAELLQQMMDGVLSIPINFPFTRFSRGMQASTKVRTMIMDLIDEKRAALKQHNSFTHQDLITCLINFQSENNSTTLSDEEIIDNVIGVMFAGYDTSSVLITFLVRILASDQSVYAALIQKQEEITKNKVSGELLTWNDLAKMKYTWRVSLDTLRMYPPCLVPSEKSLKILNMKDTLFPEAGMYNKIYPVVWTTFTTHMDESYFPNPSKFNPTRFEKQAQSAPPYSFVAFGGGPRICPGNEFARIETLVTIRFRWKLCCMDTSFSRNPFPVFKQGLEIQIQPKNSVSAK